MRFNWTFGGIAEWVRALNFASSLAWRGFRSHSIQHFFHYLFLFFFFLSNLTSFVPDHYHMIMEIKQLKKNINIKKILKYFLSNYIWVEIKYIKVFLIEILYLFYIWVDYYVCDNNFNHLGSSFQSIIFFLRQAK